jgi:hypothetical protein
VKEETKPHVDKLELQSMKMATIQRRKTYRGNHENTQDPKTVHIHKDGVQRKIKMG